MRVVVVGANGGIGSRVAAMLIARGDDVIGADRDRIGFPACADAIIFCQGSHEDPIFDNLVRMFSIVDDCQADIIITMAGGGVGGPTMKEPGDYTATKAGVIVWTEWAAARYPNLQFFCVAPGRTATKMTNFDGADPRIPAAFIVKLLSGKYAHLSGSLLAAQRDDLDTMKPMKLRRVEC